MKPKAQTMAQKFGFMDPELTTPQHDEIMMWLDETVTKMGAQKTYGNHPNHKWTWTDLDKADDAGLPQLLREGRIIVDPPVPVAAITSKIWESPIVDRTFTIGFADMRVIYCTCLLDADLLAKQVKDIESGTVGAFPILVTESVPARWNPFSRYFEVKPTIPSLGEVIRQVRMYQTYTGGAEWWIVSPDDKFREQIEAQGIKFLAVPSSI
jgi:hypothetical protein